MALSHLFNETTFFTFAPMKGIIILLGFMFFLLGILGIILDLVGLQFSFLIWLDGLGRLGSFLVKLIMLFGGLVVMYLYGTNWRQKDQEDHDQQVRDN